MNRRAAINRVMLIMGGSIMGADLFLSGCRSDIQQASNLFTGADIAFLNEVAETILPATSTPGAKAADVGRFMATMVQDCYSLETQQIFRAGIAGLDDRAHEIYGSKFMDVPPEQKNELLTALDKEQKTYSATKLPEDPVHFFRLMKELALLGYFSSEIGCTKALRYVRLPGKYIGCIPYKRGDKAWAT